MLTKNNKRAWLGLGVALSVAVLPITSTFAYGPERTTYTAEKPADHVVFNSITNNPHIGDERNFVRIKEVGQQGNYADSAKIVPGKEYEVYTFFHNNASSTLNTKEHDYKGIARGVKMLAKMPSVIRKGQTADITSTISATNATPGSVWDHVTISSPERDVALKYIPDSAEIHSQGAVNGKKLPSKMFTEGALLGYSDMNGILPGCTDYMGWVTYRFKAEFSDFSVSKSVAEYGKGNWAKNQNTTAGSKVDFKIHYKNIGTTAQNNVNVKDILPKGLKYVSGTTKLFNANNQNGKPLSDNLTTSGINIGDYSFGAEATVSFTAEVESQDKLVCGNNLFTNTAQIHTVNGAKQDTATVTVKRDCTPKETEEQCKIPGKGNLKKDDKNCREDKCKVPGKEGLTPNDPNCSEPCRVKGLEKLKAGDPNCVEIPSELPKTGPMEAALMIIAVMALTGAAAYWFRSREEFKKATAGVGHKDYKAVKTEEEKSEK